MQVVDSVRKMGSRAREELEIEQVEAMVSEWSEPAIDYWNG